MGEFSSRAREVWEATAPGSLDYEALSHEYAGSPMRLVTYYGVLEPKAIYRIVVDGDDVRGFVSCPEAPAWRRSGRIVREVQLRKNEIHQLPPEEALFVVRTWGGTADSSDDPALAPAPSAPASNGLHATNGHAPHPEPAAPPPPPPPAASATASYVMLDEPFELWRDDPPPPSPTDIARTEILRSLHELARENAAEPSAGPSWT